ncbi:MAG: ammonia channel protein, partial [Alphaproteobacteria bacterium]
IVGAILTGVFALESIGGASGLIEGNAGQVLTQIMGVAITMAYCAVATFILLKVIEKTIGLRVDETTETIGLDIALHGERGYEL